MDALDVFNRHVGRLRVSVTHACQLHCLFCHQEGIENHWRPIHMPPTTFSAMLSAFSSLGGREVNVTGGEPLVHPHISELLSILSGFDGYRALCTNGLLLERVADLITPSSIDEVKISVHAQDDIVGKQLLGRAWSKEKLGRGLEFLAVAGVNFTMNFTVTSSNRHELVSVLDLAEEFGGNVLIIDLISTRWNPEQRGLGRVEFNEAERLVRGRATHLQRMVDRTGCVMDRYVRPDGRFITIKDVTKGLMHTGMCAGCSVKDRCGEGVFVLRADAERTLRPCLLRRDLERRDLNVDVDDSVGNWTIRLRDMIEFMMASPVTTSAGESIYHHSE